MLPRVRASTRRRRPRTGDGHLPDRLRGAARASCTAGSWPCSSTASSSTTTATSGVAGKTTALSVRYRRPTPLLTPLALRRSSATSTDGRIHSTARLLRRRPPAVRGRGRRRRRRPLGPARGVAPTGDRMTSPAIDAGDGLPAHRPRAAARRGRPSGPTRCCWSCDDDRLTYADADAPLGRAGPGPARRRASARAPTSASCTPTASDFVVAWLAAARIGAVSVPLSTFSTSRRAGRPAARRRRRPCCWRRRRTGRTTTPTTLRRGVPELDLAAPPPLLAAVGAVAAPHRVRRRDGDRHVHPGWTVAGAARRRPVRSATTCSPRPRPPSRPADRMVIVHTSGSTSAPKGVIHTHGALIRHLDNLNQIRRYTPDEVLFSNSPFFWIGGFAYALLGTLVAGATLVVLQRGRRRPACSTCSSASGRRWSTASPQSVAHLPDDPSFAGRGPVVDPARQPLADHAGRRPAGRPRAAPHDARHDRGRQRVPGQRRRGRPARAPPGLVRPAGARLRGRGRRPRHRRRRAAPARSGELLVPRPVPDGGLLRARAPRDLRRRRLVPHRRPRVGRRRRLLLLPRPPRRHDQDRGRQRVAARGRGRDRSTSPGSSPTSSASTTTTAASSWPPRCACPTAARSTSTSCARGLAARLSAYKVPRTILRASPTTRCR